MSTDTPPTDWGLLRDLLTADHARLEKAAKDNPELGIWYAGIQQGIGYALAYMDGIESEPGGSR